METLTIFITPPAPAGSCRKCNHLFFQRNNLPPTKYHKGFTTIIRSFAKRSSVKKLKRNGENKIQQTNRDSSDQCIVLADKSSTQDDFSVDINGVASNGTLGGKNATPSASRGDVLQACTVTSGMILALALVIRQVSHIAFTGGWPVHDCSTEVPFNFETWHLELILGLVMLVSSCRYLLLRTWPDFAESSEAANRQVLGSLQPLDYIIVACLPGVSEELLFRGALMPLFGLNWKSALVVATIFGLLHLGSGRRFSFAVWATFVGLAYGSATIVSSSIVVPMTCHAFNNLIGGVMWRYIEDK